LIARAIHYNSSRADQPFVGVNCAALPETLIESELFGHEKGSFTGAVAQHTGRFELANQGTLFLDEIGSITPAAQAKLLRVLQDRTFERVGGTRKIQVDVRLITATNEDLEGKVKSGQFREDLYYRIQVFPIQLPALRDRKDDIPLLIDHYLRIYCKDNQFGLKKVSPDALQQLTSYRWNGNVRELENMVQTLVLTSDGDAIEIRDLPSYVLAESPSKDSTSTDGLPLDEAVDRFEKLKVMDALQKTGGVKAEAARLLGIDKNRMKYLCRKHDL
jgi:transcriptional regulator with GAF, ATPase, and Fis domain